MPEPLAEPLRPAAGGFFVRLAAGLLIVITLIVGTGFWMSGQSRIIPRVTSPVVPTPGGEQPLVAGGKPTPGQVGGVPLFAGWPKANPDLVIVLSGQTYGYLKPCGCSQFQLGGLERRANFMQQMRDKGWPVVGLDLGDALPPKDVKALRDQSLMKYETQMHALREMGYSVIGLGETDFAHRLFDLLGRYTLNNAGKAPTVLAGNIIGVQRNLMGQVVQATAREKYFEVKGGRPMIESVDIVEGGKVPVGVVGVIGSSVAKKIIALDPDFDFQPNDKVLKEALAEMEKTKAKPELKVLLYQGTEEEAKRLATDFPQFQLILCLSEDSEPPMLPVLVNDKKTTIVKVGHKGRYVGAVGVFKTDKGFELKYQLVPMGEEYNTPEKPEAEAAQKILPLLQKYAEEVKKENLLAAVKKKDVLQHPTQLKFPKADVKYVGADVCAKCHAAEHKVWGLSKHSHAYDALEKIAKRPSLRNYDPECIKCHVVGYEFQSGFTNAVDTKQFMHNGCENCHGPGSAHSDKPKDKDYIAAMFPWRIDADDKLPPKEFMETLGKLDPLERGKIEIPAKQQRVINAVESMCRKCHDNENDPKFDFYLYFPKIHHSGLKAQGLPPGAK